MATLNRIFKLFSLGNLRLLGRDCSGATVIETSLLVSLLAIAILSGAQEVGPVLISTFDQTEAKISSAIEGVGCDGGIGGSGGGSGVPGGGEGSGGGCGVGGGGSGGGAGTGGGSGGSN